MTWSCLKSRDRSNKSTKNYQVSPTHKEMVAIPAKEIQVFKVNCKYLNN